MFPATSEICAATHTPSLQGAVPDVRALLRRTPSASGMAMPPASPAASTLTLVREAPGTFARAAGWEYAKSRAREMIAAFHGLIVWSPIEREAA